MNQWSLVIGLEVHVQLSTKSKLFSRSSSLFGQTANTQCNEIDMALPGALPIPNKYAFELAIKFGLITNAKIANYTQFDRKNYFYPDLPKGYQITQHYYPIVIGGYINILDHENKIKKIRIHHAHLEEDAGKSMHLNKYSAVDLNRSGNTLLEIVSEPDLRSASEAVEYLKKIHQLVRYFDISDANMQEGSFRVDVNVSVRPSEADEMRTRVEIKNVNSFKFIEKAILYEYNRQIECYTNNIEVIQETRKFNETTQITESMRDKESAADYRYFPDPDLPVIHINEKFIENIKNKIGELPEEKRARLMSYGLSYYDADVITQDKNTADIFDQLVTNGIAYKTAANWLMVNVQSLLNKHQLTWSNLPLSTANITSLLKCIEDGIISGNQAKEILEIMWDSNTDPKTIIENRGMQQITNHESIKFLIDEILQEHPNQVQQYLAGQEKLFGFFIGQLMKKSSGKINPNIAQDMMKEALKNV